MNRHRRYHSARYYKVFWLNLSDFEIPLKSHQLHQPMWPVCPHVFKLFASKKTFAVPRHCCCEMNKKRVQDWTHSNRDNEQSQARQSSPRHDTFRLIRANRSSWKFKAHSHHTTIRPHIGPGAKHAHTRSIFTQHVRIYEYQMVSIA